MGLTTQIGMFRHGLTSYKQMETTLKEADDLLEEGIPILRERAHEFVSLLPTDRIVHIYSSPMGRTLHTARILEEVCREHCLNTSPIQTDDRLTEVRNFVFNLYLPLAEGGVIELAGSRFEIDSRITNPGGLSLGKYFMEDACHRLDEKLKGKVPEEYLGLLVKFEAFADIRARGIDFLRYACGLHLPSGDSVIASTHEALVYHPLDVFSRGTLYSLERGDYIHLEADEKGLRIKRAGRLTEGDNSRDILNGI